MIARREQTAEAFHTAVAAAVRQSAEALACSQSPEGFWLSRVTASAPLEADYVLLHLWLDPVAHRRRIQKAVRTILGRQLPDGGFSTWPGGPADLNATIKAYTALKLAGLEEPRLIRARDTIVRLGGLHAANTQLKLTLSLFGLYPGGPGEPVFCLPAATESLAILHCLNMRRETPARLSLNELQVGRRAWSFGDRLAGISDKLAVKVMGTRTIRRAEKRLLEQLQHNPDTDFTSTMYALMALDALGYASEHPARAAAEKQLQALMSESQDEITVQPRLAPVQDTATAAFALGESGQGGDLICTGDWLLRQQTARNSAMVLLALSHTKATDETALRIYTEGTVSRLLGERPAHADTTGVVVKALCGSGISSTHPAIVRAVDHLFRTQEQDGSWRGTQGVNYIYGTCHVLRGLQAAGVSDREAAVLRAGEWLRSIQNADGGWGESCASYSEQAFVPAESTASQTAWAILGLLAGGDSTSLSVRKGIEYLVDSQRAGGVRDERMPTLCESPGCYLISHLHSNSFALLALSTFLKTRREVAKG